MSFRAGEYLAALREISAMEVTISFFLLLVSFTSTTAWTHTGGIKQSDTEMRVLKSRIMSVEEHVRKFDSLFEDMRDNQALFNRIKHFFLDKERPHLLHDKEPKTDRKDKAKKDNSTKSVKKNNSVKKDKSTKTITHVKTKVSARGRYGDGKFDNVDKDANEIAQELSKLHKSVKTAKGAEKEDMIKQIRDLRRKQSHLRHYTGTYVLYRHGQSKRKTDRKDKAKETKSVKKDNSLKKDKSTKTMTHVKTKVSARSRYGDEKVDNVEKDANETAQALSKLHKSVKTAKGAEKEDMIKQIMDLRRKQSHLSHHMRGDIRLGHGRSKPKTDRKDKAKKDNSMKKTKSVEKDNSVKKDKPTKTITHMKTKVSARSRYGDEKFDNVDKDAIEIAQELSKLHKSVKTAKGAEKEDMIKQMRDLWRNQHHLRHSNRGDIQSRHGQLRSRPDIRKSTLMKEKVLSSSPKRHVLGDLQTGIGNSIKDTKRAMQNFIQTSKGKLRPKREIGGFKKWEIKTREAMKAKRREQKKKMKERKEEGKEKKMREEEKKGKKLQGKKECKEHKGLAEWKRKFKEKREEWKMKRKEKKEEWKVKRKERREERKKKRKEKQEERKKEQEGKINEEKEASNERNRRRKRKERKKKWEERGRDFKDKFEKFFKINGKNGDE